MSTPIASVILLLMFVQFAIAAVGLAARREPLTRILSAGQMLMATGLLLLPFADRSPGNVSQTVIVLALALLVAFVLPFLVLMLDRRTRTEASPTEETS